MHSVQLKKVEEMEKANLKKIEDRQGGGRDVVGRQAKRKMTEDRQGEVRDVVGRKAKQKMIEYRQKGVKDVEGRKARRKMTEDQQKKDAEQIAGSNYIATDQFSQGRKVQSDHEFRKAPNPNA
ncbi:hypothetical protein BC938DRAFT_474698 [Jimgerdemannia flammicorona]|uniref:Uncharacterized protein n=1 Tax=Jimgerdemannia flammicorona TaxID=994334 RepID=A0A433Q1W2_9FUNG|nr:hypothetical protein BC938DRAFT_474698 [Jimgerdemannia flammicorona]